MFFTVTINVWTFLKLRSRLTRKEIINYLYLMASITGWVLCNAAADLLTTPNSALLAAQLSIIFPLNILNALLKIISNFPRIIEKPLHSFIFKVGSYMTGFFTLLSLVFLTSDFNISQFSGTGRDAAHFTPGYLYYLLTLFAVIFLLFILFYWRRRFSLYTTIQKRQVISLLAALISVYISMIMGLFIFPILGLHIYAPFMFISLAFLLFIINKSLWIKVAVVDILEEFAKLSGIIISSLILMLFWSFSGFANADLNILAKFLVSLIVMIFTNFIYSKFQSVYTKRRSDSQNEVRHFIDLSTSLVNLEDIVREARVSLNKLLAPKDIKFELIDPKNKAPLQEYLSVWQGLRSKIPIINREVLIESYFDKDNNKEITYKLYNYLLENNINILIPVANQNSLVALIYIYNTERILNESDYNNLTLLANSVSVSMNRALLYRELQIFNQTLQQKVNEQTKELQIKVQELEEARRKEADMIDIMGHELRTPATIVKLNVDLLHNFIEKIPEDRESFTKYVTRIKDAVETEIKLINTLLSSAKLEGDKIEINPEKVDIYKEIDMALHGEERNAQEKNLEIVNLVSEHISPVFADRARTVEILNNLISNAVKYTEKGSVTVKAEEIENFIQISITDTGRGIPQEDISKLGTKFFRTKTYIQSEDLGDDIDIVRPGGTGLGLYVTFNLVKKMGGNISVQSEVGKGSTFTFTLPKYKDQDQLVHTHTSNNMFERLGLTK